MTVPRLAKRLYSGRFAFAHTMHFEDQRLTTRRPPSLEDIELGDLDLAWKIAMKRRVEETGKALVELCRA